MKANTEEKRNGRGRYYVHEAYRLVSDPLIVVLIFVRGGVAVEGAPLVAAPVAGHVEVITGSMIIDTIVLDTSTIVICSIQQ
jgi:hypothetical protein